MMSVFSRDKSGSDGTSFLPDDFLAQKLERRANHVLLTLFFVVIFVVVGAFFVTHRQWTSVKTQQEQINIRYTQAAQKIDQLKELEKQKKQMLHKAELTTALIERVPRTVLLAELINRMPDHLTLLQLDLKSKRIKKKPPVIAAKNGAVRSLVNKAGSQGAAQSEADTPSAPQFDSTLSITGVAIGHEQVAQYVAALQKCPLLENIELKFSQSTIIDDHGFKKFLIETRLRPNADARSIDPLDATQIRAFGETKKLGSSSRQTADAQAKDGED